MRKQYVIGALMIFTTICLVPFSKENLQACVKNATVCPMKLKQQVRTGTADCIEDADASFNMFMNPIS